MADVIIQSETLENIANSIRTSIDSQEKINPLNFPQKIKEVYEKRNIDWWNGYTDNWTRIYYRYGFTEAGWNDETFNPPRTIYPVTDARYMFQNSAITSINENQVDFSEFTGSFRTTFAGMTSLKSLRLKFGNNISGFFSDTFTNCTELENLIILGTIEHDGFNVQWSTKLMKDSIISIFMALSTTTSGLSITLSKTAVNNAFGIDVDDEATYPEGSPYYELRHLRDNWTINYI